jgi:hypothetical protein
MHEYGDPFTPEAIDAAISRVLYLQRRQPGEALDDHVEQALHEKICACALDIEDQVEGGRSGLHQAIAQEVHDRAELTLRRRARWSAPLDKVDQASDESFPASDPPGWI